LDIEYKQLLIGSVHSRCVAVACQSSEFEQELKCILVIYLELIFVIGDAASYG